MKFRTEIETAPSRVRIGYSNRVLALGSCFADHMACRLAQAKFAVTANPTGPLFNPVSLADALEAFASRRPVAADELHRGADGRWCHFDFHGRFDASSADEALAAMNEARRLGREALRRADRVVLTLGTAWVYERGGRAVANCHKFPAAEFVRRRLGPDETVAVLDAALAGPLAGKEVLLTVSPVRHLGDGLEGNAVSKAVLRLAAEELAARHAAVSYFPAFEILNDDLRDYRFYADDLVHPSPQAVAYIWERFAATVLTERAQRLLPEVESLVAAAAHRPFDARSEAYIAFCRKQLARIEALPEVDFTHEARYFRRCIEINS